MQKHRKQNIMIFAAVLLHVVAVTILVFAVQREMRLIKLDVPDSIVFDDPDGAYVPAFAQQERVVYITVDDGPSRDATPQILAVLRKHNVRATFFVLPRDGCDDLYEQILAGGNYLGNHSYSHDYSVLYGTENAAEFRADTLRAENWLREKFGYETTLYRYPGGASGRPSAIIEPRDTVLRALGYTRVDWDISFGDDAPRVTPETMLANALNGIAGRDTVTLLLHDTATSAEALDMFIQEMKSRGYVFN
ncbi:MAG: polysaccharide deacetylase family protein [Oscillospiraceae bacterium]|nr:polysaccharide deacetylase family protein [Oscillospiraceae bacterium]